MKKYIITLAFALIIFGSPITTHAAALTQPQVNAIIGLLEAFGVNAPTIESVRLALGATAPTAPVTNQPTVSPVQTITPIADPVPTHLSVELNRTEVLGANCEPVYAEVEVSDQYGNALNDQTINLSTPDGVLVEKTRQHANDEGRRPSANFAYKPSGTDREETMFFSSGTLTESLTIKLRSGLRGTRLASDGSDWYEVSGGMRVDKDRMLCK